MPIQIRIRIDINTMPILMRILPQVLHMLENPKFFIFSRSIATLQCFSSVPPSESSVFSILDNTEFSGGKKATFVNIFICLELMPIRIGRIQIGMP